MSGEKNNGLNKYVRAQTLPTPKPELSDSVLDMFSMKGKVVIVTGGSGGIGHEVGKAMAEAGADVALWYNSSKKTEEYCAEIEKKYGVKSKAYQCNLSDYDAVKGRVDEVIKDFGGLTHMICNAGVPSQAGCLDSKPEDWLKVVNTDFNGAFWCAKAAAHHFEKQGKGNIIFTGSMSGHIANVPNHQGCYNACKAGIIHLAKSLAVEFAPWCRVNCVSPGYIDTEISEFAPKEVKDRWHELTPFGREADPRELKGVYLYLASDASTYTTGADIVVDGGYCCK